MSRKYPIEWHESSLANMRSTLDGIEIELARLQEHCDQLKSDISFLSVQIAEAKEMGKDGFDAERFMVSQR